MKGALMRTCVLCQLGLEVTDALPLLGRHAHIKCAIEVETRTNVAVAAMGRALVYVGKLGPWSRMQPANQQLDHVSKQGQ